MSEKEYKVQELALFWGVSVTTTWNRIKKEGLATFKKKDQTGKEVTYIRISEEFLGRYVNNVVNNDITTDNNRYYEELLTSNNVNNNYNNLVNNVENVQNTQQIHISPSELIDKITTIYNDNNNQLQKVNEELITYKAKALLLEDKANREGYYINEINGLQKDNKRLQRLVETFKYIVIGLLITLSIIITMFIMSYKPVTEQEPVIETVAPKIVQPTPTEAKVPVKAVRKR